MAVAPRTVVNKFSMWNFSPCRQRKRRTRWQHYVLSQAMPAWRITPYLMLIDPTVPCQTESLGTRIRVSSDGAQVAVNVDPTLAASDFAPPLLARHDVSAEVQEILKSEFSLGEDKLDFSAYEKSVADDYAAGGSFAPVLGKRMQVMRILLRA
jgi:hypothetical protein